MLLLQQTNKYSVLDARQPHPVEEPARVLLTQGTAVFVERKDGTRAWVEREDDWKEGLKTYLETIPVVKHTAPPDPAAIVQRALNEWREGHAVVLRGLLSQQHLSEVHACAKNCVSEAWGTIRRRSVGLPDGTAFPQQTHLRLSKHFQEKCPQAWHTLLKAVALVDWGTWPRFSGEAALQKAFKQADYLLYQNSDSVGWHDHFGESLLFCVAVLGGDFDGGAFSYRPLDGPAAVEVVLKAGDVIVCASELEHRVGPVTRGARVSLNVDFWDVDASDDRRSAFDRY